MTDTNFALAIIGMGPRGHYALECFISEMATVRQAEDIQIIVFEETDQIGNGPVWDTTQSNSNWSNVNERIIELPARQKVAFGGADVPTFPSYHDWAGFDPKAADPRQPDVYPKRMTIGRYLSQRCGSLISPLRNAGIVTLVKDRVDNLTSIEGGVQITTKAGQTFQASQAVITVGHQPTVHDAQIEGWATQISSTPHLTLRDHPYPVTDIVDDVRQAGKATIAVRGYGLATIDVARAVAEAFGTFEIAHPKTRQQSYTPAGGTDFRIVPFSLDGMPMGPKPVNAEVDAQFAPSQDAFVQLRKVLSDPAAQANARGNAFLLDALAPIIADQFQKLAHTLDGAPSDAQDLQVLITTWINDQSTRHACITDADVAPDTLLQSLADMATGTAPISLDYCIGQVWRHCHPIIYAALSHGRLPDDARADIIFTDEAIKRYSYGPPVESLQQLLALHAAKVLDLTLVNDPEIALTADGWVLSNDDTRTTANIMVDAVLDAPKIKDVRSELMTALLRDGMLCEVHDDLGVATEEDGFLMTKSGQDAPVAVLGRLAKGTIIGVDAILECFGERPRAWAKGAVQRLDRSST